MNRKTSVITGVQLGLCACVLIALILSACQQQPYVVCEESNLVCRAGYECSPAGDFCLPVSDCGNGRIDHEEVCDDGNRVSGDGCSQDCQSDETCGNKTRDHAETCDDGNRVSGDGCSATCIDENCGNGKLDRGELCDDGDR